MKGLIYLLVLSLLFISCSKEEPNFTVNGEIRGLKKGTLYLERPADTNLVVLDSMLVNGDPSFVMQTRIAEPEILVLRLDVSNTESQRLRFFADKGVTQINTSLKRFEYDAKITGSSQQALLDDFNKMISQFNDQNLELIKKRLEAGNDSLKIAKITEDIDQLLRRKYLFAINFAVTNKSSQVAPYIALAEIFDANIKYLDTIYTSLPDSIAKSKYGKELADYIQELKSLSSKDSLQ